MGNRSKSLAIFGMVSALLLGTPSMAMAAPAPAAPSGADKVVVGGQKYGPKDGLEVTTESHEVVPGEGPLEVVYGGTSPESEIIPFATWGSSYATSTETAYVFFTGRAKAAGNVYNNQRIIQVCISYSHVLRSSPTVCSTARSTGSSWIAGSEATVSFTDNLSDNWPQTSFNITTTRINPYVY